MGRYCGTTCELYFQPSPFMTCIRESLFIPEPNSQHGPDTKEWNNVARIFSRNHPKHRIIAETKLLSPSSSLFANFCGGPSHWASTSSPSIAKGRGKEGGRETEGGRIRSAGKRKLAATAAAEDADGLVAPRAMWTKDEGRCASLIKQTVMRHNWIGLEGEECD